MTKGSVSFNDAWKKQGAILLLLLLLLGYLYYPTFFSIVSIWIRSETFTHGFIIIPIVLWLFWRIREQLVLVKPKVNNIGLPLLFILGVVWLLATYVDILAIKQLAAVSMIPVLFLTIIGWQATKVALFPLFFLLLAVPLGEELTPVLIEFTADFTVMMIKLVGIPIYREGNFLQLPTGNWSVVSACSGVRYLIASVTLGLLYAYLNYNGLLKRGVFVAVSIITPIIANGLRAFIIVMIGHYSDMKLATGVDHLVYGWLFFGIVIAIMFYIGSYWWDESSSINISEQKVPAEKNKHETAMEKATVLFAGVILVIWPIKVDLEQKVFDLSALPQFEMATPSGWKKVDQQISWKPAYTGMDRVYSMSFENEANRQVELFIAYYADQRQGSELGNYNNVLITEKDNIWRLIDSGSDVLYMPESDINIPIAVISSTKERLKTIYFYYVDGQLITNKYKTKIAQAKVKLLNRHNDGAAIFISAKNSDSYDPVKDLRQFIQSSMPNIKAALNNMR